MSALSHSRRLAARRAAYRTVLVGAVAATVALAALAVALNLPALRSLSRTDTDRPLVARPDDRSLAIDSEPQGAMVYINGRYVGRTPIRLTGVEPGTHALKLVRDGFRTRLESVRVPVDGAGAGAAALRVYRLEEPPHGSLRVESIPAGADVSLDGQPVGSTPCVLPEVKAGPHRLLLSRTNFLPWQDEVVVLSGREAHVTAELADRVLAFLHRQVEPYRSRSPKEAPSAEELSAADHAFGDLAQYCYIHGRVPESAAALADALAFSSRCAHAPAKSLAELRKIWLGWYPEIHRTQKKPFQDAFTRALFGLLADLPESDLLADETARLFTPMEKLEAGLAAFEAAAPEFEDAPLFWAALADLRFRRKRFHDADEALARVQAEVAASRPLAAAALARSGALSLALATHLEPEAGRGALERARALLEAALSRAGTDDPRVARVHHDLYLTAVALGEGERALDALSRAAAAQRETKTQALWKLELAGLLADASRFERALEIYTELSKSAPQEQVRETAARRAEELKQRIEDHD